MHVTVMMGFLQHEKFDSLSWVFFSLNVLVENNPLISEWNFSNWRHGCSVVFFFCQIMQCLRETYWHRCHTYGQYLFIIELWKNLYARWYIVFHIAYIFTLDIEGYVVTEMFCVLTSQSVVVWSHLDICIHLIVCYSVMLFPCWESLNAQLLNASQWKNLGMSCVIWVRRLRA